MVFSPAELGPPPAVTLTLAADDGLALAADHVAGPGPGLLLAHGFGQTRQAWSATQRRLAAAGRASLAWDVRGHGGSARNPVDSRYSGEQFVADVIVAARKLGPEGPPTKACPPASRPVLVGASMGGLTGLMAQALAQPFSALVLVDITPRWEASGVERILGFMGAFPEGFASYDDAAEKIAAYLPHRRARKTPAQLAHLLQRRGDGRLVWHWDPRLLAEFIPDTNGLQDRLDDACRTLDVPVLLVSGGRSDLVTAPTIAHFLELAPHARHVQLSDATHMVAGDDNDAFTDSLLTFLSDLPAVPTAAPGDPR